MDGEIAVVGAGIGGLAVAGFLTQAGFRVTVYEQARRFERVGAGIQMSPNAVRVLRALGLEDRLRAVAFTPPTWSHRAADTNDLLGDLVLGPEAEARFGAPYLVLHRGDLHAALWSVVAPEVVRFRHRLAGIDPAGGAGQRLRLRFEDGSAAEADAVVGADGVHSRVRELLLGPERPRFTGRVAHRTTFPSHLVSGFTVTTNTKWWGSDRHIVIYPVTANADELYYVTSVPDPDWDTESWSARCDPAEVVEAMAGFNPEVRAVVAAAPEAHKWALFERDPLSRWGEGPVVLLGDACHPMTPYMAQGAATSLEDAAVLARALARHDEPAVAFAAYEATRLDRTARVQLTSRQNTWGRAGGDTGWLYGYDALTVTLAPPGR